MFMEKKIIIQKVGIGHWAPDIVYQEKLKYIINFFTSKKFKLSNHF